jgi:hypothetical protein
MLTLRHGWDLFIASRRILFEEMEEAYRYGVIAFDICMV